MCALVVAQVVVSAHYLVVPHTTCEHGDLVHGDSAHDHEASAHDHEALAHDLGAMAHDLGASPNDEVGKVSWEASSSVAPTLELGHDHDHCILGIEARKWTTSPEDEVLLARAPGALQQLDAAVSGTPVSSIDLLALAPKGSPPV